MRKCRNWQTSKTKDLVSINISIVKDMLGHADESTTLKHYIYNTENSRETDEKVLNALGEEKTSKSDQSDQKIISFTKIIVYQFYPFYDFFRSGRQW